MIQVCRKCGVIAGGLVSDHLSGSRYMTSWPEPDLCPQCYDGPQRCPSCGKTEPEVTFDTDTFSSDCDECVGYARALPRAYNNYNRQRGL